jgi:hypothetical protein
MALWTVARYPSGEWDTGGNPTDPEYANCEVFVVDANHRDEALVLGKKARQAKVAKEKRLAKKAQANG